MIGLKVLLILFRPVTALVRWTWGTNGYEQTVLAEHGWQALPSDD